MWYIFPPLSLRQVGFISPILEMRKMTQKKVYLQGSKKVLFQDYRASECKARTAAQFTQLQVACSFSI